MPVEIKKKPIAAKVEVSPPVETTPEPQPAPAVHAKPLTSSQPKAVTPSWMLTGAKAKEAQAAEAAKVEMAKEAAKKMFRFRLAVDETSQITFLDGNLDAEGMLDVLSYWEHTVQLNNKWENFICVGAGHDANEGEPCPLCESGVKRALVSVMTVIDHKPYTIKKGPKQGQVIVNQRKLFVAKSQTMAKLRFKADNLKGLAGCKFAVARLGDQQSPGVGTEFDFIERKTPAELVAMYGDEGKVADYAKELVYLPASKLIALGLGKAPVGPGYPASGFNAQAMSEQL